MAFFRPPKYPFSQSTRFTFELFEGGLTIPAANLVREVWQHTFRALAYLDVLDQGQEVLTRGAKRLQQDLATTRQEMARLQTDVQALQTTLDTLVGFFGVVIPDWQTKGEVEEGDDLGLVHPSAAALGLLVDFVIDQANPAFEHEQVEAITPPPGTLVARGSTVTVLINLQG
jgi:hypothetical protein